MNAFLIALFTIPLAQQDEAFDIGHLLTALFILFMIGSAVINIVRQAKKENERQEQSRFAGEQRQDAAASQQAAEGRRPKQPDAARQRPPQRQTADNPLDMFLQSIGLEPTQPGDGRPRPTQPQKPDPPPPPLPSDKPQRQQAVRQAERRPAVPPSGAKAASQAEETRQRANRVDRLAREEAARTTRQRFDISEQMAQHRKSESEAVAAQSYALSSRQEAARHLERKAGIEHAPEGVREQIRKKTAGGEEPVEMGRLPAKGERYPCKLVAVADGETVRVELGGKPQTVRLIGIESPSPGQPLHRESIEALKRMVEERQIELEYERPGRREFDNHERLFAYLYADGWLVNRQMTLNGWSWVSESLGRRRLRNDLTVAQGQARMRGLGVWRKGGEPAREKLARLKSHSPIVQALVMSEVLRPPKALRGRRF